MEPTDALLALDDQLGFAVSGRAGRAMAKRGTWTTHGVVVKPSGIEARVARSTSLAHSTPFALPCETIDKSLLKSHLKMRSWLGSFSIAMATKKRTGERKNTTLTIALRNVVERRIHAVNVIGDVALVAEEQSSLVIPLSTAFTNRAVWVMKQEMMRTNRF